MITEDDINKALAGENPDDQPGAEKPAHILTPEMLGRSVQPISKIIAKKTQIPEIELDDEDVDQLTNALQPFADELDQLIKYIKYLPIALFSGMYAIRIYQGWQDKHKKSKQQAPPPPDKPKEYPRETITPEQVVNPGPVTLKEPPKETPA